jgi:NosR/NirI family nitrous oxide reductase transcriptional regulator
MALEIIGEILKLTVFGGLSLAGILVILIWMKDLTRKVSYLRIFIQIVSLVGIYYLLTYPVWLVLVLSVIFIMTLVSGRFFCGWICPFGLYIDLITLLRKAFKIRYRNLPEKLNRALHILRYGLLVFFLILPFLVNPINPWQWPLSLFLAGPFKLLRILVAPLTPLIVPWTEELTAINGLNLSYPYLDQIIAYSSENLVWIFIFVFVALTVASSFFMRRFWCRFCPTGASMAIVNRFKGFKWIPVLHIDKDEEKCTKCGICKRVCPLQVTEVYKQKGGKITTSMCMLCFRCVEMCPYEDCLKVKLAGKTAFKSRNWLEPSESE